MFNRRKNEEFTELLVVVAGTVVAIHDKIEEVEKKLSEINERLRAKGAHDGDLIDSISQTCGNLKETLERIDKRVRSCRSVKPCEKSLGDTEGRNPERIRKEKEEENVTVRQIVDEWLNGDGEE